MMAAKKAKKPVEQVASLDDGKILVFKATKPLTKVQFDLAEKMLRDQEEKVGVKVLLIPFSTELDQKEGDVDGNIGQR